MGQATLPTQNLYFPSTDGLVRFSKTTDATSSSWENPQTVGHAIRELIQQKNYPCLAALKSLHQKDYQVGLYDKFGSAKSWRNLRNDLLFFIQEQKKSQSIYLSFWAVFEPADFSEDEFETALWNELSHLTSVENRPTDWNENNTSDPLAPEFRLSLDGVDFFIVGLHAKSSRKSRQFPYPTLIFNVFDQFEELERRNQYLPLVRANRERDQKFQGDVNPMVKRHGDQWESIQFSGRANPPDWKCPFRFIKTADKP